MFVLAFIFPVNMTLLGNIKISLVLSDIETIYARYWKIYNFFVEALETSIKARFVQNVRQCMQKEKS